VSTSIKTIERKPRVSGDSPPPLALLLHGYGSHERDLFDFADQLDPRLHVVSARAPLSLPWGGYAWYHLGGAPGRLLPDAATRTAAVELLERFVAGLPANVGADPARVYLLGFSQGAIMSLALAARRRELLAGVVAISGYLDPDTLPVPAPSFAGLPILQLHGSHDDVIPVVAAHMTRDALQGTEARHEYHEYAIGHGIHPAGLGQIQRWLAARLDEPR
jgi:phospholipase/carboxylesterase